VVYTLTFALGPVVVPALMYVALRVTRRLGW
jgi:hypothetical protein